MKKVIVLFCFYILTLMAYSQNLIIGDSALLKKGIYKNFEEFKYNSPSIPLDYEVLWGRILYGGLDAVVYHDTLYNLKLEKEKAKEIGLVWGFCDGKNAYINMQFKPMTTKKIFKPNSQFDKILYLGRYCYFITAQPQGNSVYPGHCLCIIDINTGQEIYINNLSFKKIMSKDASLYEDYKNEKFFTKTSDENILKYLRFYSEKHKDEIIVK